MPHCCWQGCVLVLQQPWGRPGPQRPRPASSPVHKPHLDTFAADNEQLLCLGGPLAWERGDPGQAELCWVVARRQRPRPSVAAIRRSAPAGKGTTPPSTCYHSPTELSPGPCSPGGARAASRCEGFCQNPPPGTPTPTKGPQAKGKGSRTLSHLQMGLERRGHLPRHLVFLACQATKPLCPLNLPWDAMIRAGSG